MSGDNYIGSKISLISLSDIRYVGKLHSINPQDSTVGLEQVRSFGTEGRRGKPDEEIPPSDNVYEFVVFRGTDIKDLQVFEAPPKPAPAPMPPQDPAIMSTGYPPMPYGMPQANHWPQQQPLPPGHAHPMHPPMPLQQQPPLHLQQPFSSTFPQQPELPLQQKPQQKSQQQQQQSAQPQVQAQSHQQPRQKQQARQQPEAAQPRPQSSEPVETVVKRQTVSPPAAQKGINEAAIESLAKKVSEMNMPADSSEPRPRRQSNHHRTPKKTELNIPKTDFDFESSNSRFEKTKAPAGEEEDEVVHVHTQSLDDTCYDSKSSFFDNISCESKERNEQQSRGEHPRKGYFQEERKLNMETFGQATIEHPRQFGRNRGRGGRGGYYGNNNKQRDQGNRYQQQTTKNATVVPLV